MSKERPAPVLGDFKVIIKEWLESDQQVARKQRHTSVRIDERLRNEYGYNGSASGLRRYVGQIKRELGLSRREVFIPLEQVFGEAEIDWGEATAIISGQQQKIKIFAISFIPTLYGDNDNIHFNCQYIIVQYLTRQSWNSKVKLARIDIDDFC